MDAEQRTTMRLEIFAVIFLSLFLGTTAKPSWEYRRPSRAASETIVRREPLARSRPDLMVLKDKLEELTVSVADVVDVVDKLREEVAEEIRVVREKINPANRPEMKCRTAFTWWHETVGRTLEYLDNFDVHCRHGEFLRQWRMTWGEQGNRKAIRYVCCHFTKEQVRHISQERVRGRAHQGHSAT